MRYEYDREYAEAVKCLQDAYNEKVKRIQAIVEDTPEAKNYKIAKDDLEPLIEKRDKAWKAYREIFQKTFLEEEDTIK